MGDVKKPGEHRPLCIGPRILGVLLLLCGLARVSVFVIVAFSHYAAAETDWIFRISCRAGKTWLLGLWLIEGWGAYAIDGIVAILLVYAGIQIIRLRRSGWIAGICVLGYFTLSLALWLAAGQTKAQMWKLRSETMTQAQSELKDLFMQIDRPQIEKANRVVLFYLVAVGLSLGYLLSEWRCVTRRHHLPRRKFLRSIKGILCILIVVGLGAWTFWGMNYVRERSLITRAESGEVELTSQDLDFASRDARRKVTATIVRRFAMELSAESAKAVLTLGYVLDLSFLEAEDVDSIIVAADGTDSLVRRASYRILGRIASKEAIERLESAVKGPRDETWDYALLNLSETRARRAPDIVFEIARMEPDDRSWIINTRM